MTEIDNCPVCNTTCRLETGLEETIGLKDEREIMYATCKTCKTRWRRRDDPKVLGKLIYEKWSCRIPETNIPFPFVGGGIKIRPRWCRWVKVKEKLIPVGYEYDLKTRAPERVPQPMNILANETVSIKKKEFQQYNVILKRGNTLKGEIKADGPINIYFMDGLNFDRYFKGKSFDYEYGSEDFWEGLIEYSVPRRDEWFLILENKGKQPVKVKIYLYVLS